MSRVKRLSGYKLAVILLSLVISAFLIATLFISASGQTLRGDPANTGGDGADAPAFGRFVGSNSFFDENPVAYEAVGNIREYHPWSFTEWTTGAIADGNGNVNDSIKSMNPQATFIDGWSAFDNYYGNMAERGIEVTICVHGTAGDRQRPDYQDPDGTRSEYPSSYLGHAQSMFQLAARYGSNKDADPALVRTAAGTEKKIGLGYIKYFENFNEPSNFGFTGKQFAAMLSADYDGHMGTMGPDVGVKAADPNAKVVFGGSYVTWFNVTADGLFNDAFVVDMMTWFDANRTLEQWRAAHGGSVDGYAKYPFDVISVHGYSWDDSGFGVSAEESRYYEKFKTFVDSCNTAFPGKELFFSEFGWDTSQNSTNRASAPGHTTLETQGRWLVRQFLLAAAAGIDRARQFMMPDAGSDPINPDWFGTSGMLHGVQGSDNFKPSWYYVGTMRNVLKDASMNDIEILSDGGWTAGGAGPWVSETNGPWALKFGSLLSSDQIFALWLPTSHGDRSGENSQDYTIAVPAELKYATLVTLEDKVRWGERTDISNRIQDGILTVSITEKPIFVILGQEQHSEVIPHDYIHPRDFNTIALTPDSGDPGALFDEQRVDIKKDPMPDMQRAWDPMGINCYAVIDLGVRYSLSAIYVWDADGALAAGKVLAVYAYNGAGAPSLQPGSMTGAQVRTMLDGSEWERIAWFDFSHWEMWVEAVVNVETRYIVLGFEDGPGTFYDNPWPRDWLPVPELILRGAPAAPVTTALVAKPTASDVLVNGEVIAFDAYNINNSNYFKLRDLAYALNGTEKQFEVLWNSADNTITLISGSPYTTVGGEMVGKGSGDKAITPTRSKIYLDKNEITLTAYNIEGNNYFKLRDIGEALDFSVEWDSKGNNIIINTSKEYALESIEG